MGLCNLSAGHGTFLWLNISDVQWLGWSLSPLGTMPTQKGCLCLVRWTLRVLLYPYVFKPLLGWLWQVHAFPLAECQLELELISSAEEISSLAVCYWMRWVSTWTDSETMPHPWKAAGKILCCFDTCWWLVEVLKSCVQGSETSGVWQLGLQPLTF